MIYDDILVKEKKKTLICYENFITSFSSIILTYFQSISRYIHSEGNPSFILAVCCYYYMRGLRQRSGIKYNSICNLAYIN